MLLEICIVKRQRAVYMMLSMASGQVMIGLKAREGSYGPWWPNNLDKPSPKPTLNPDEYPNRHQL